MLKFTITILFISTFLGRTLADNHGPKYIFSFGDSYTSTNFDIFGPQPRPSNPTGNSDLGDATSALGPVWIDYLTTTFNQTPSLLYNFAVGGASIPQNFTYQVQHLFQPKYTRPIPWSGRDALFNSWIGIRDTATTWLSQAIFVQNHHGFWDSSETLFTSWIGINDVLIAWMSQPESYDEFLIPNLRTYAALMEELYSTGARKFFFVNVPPLGRSPMITSRGNELADSFTAGVDAFNSGLETLVRAFQKGHTDVEIQLYDVHTFFAGILDEPTKHGFVNSTCMDDAGCLWAGPFHILSPMHKLIAEDMDEDIEQGYIPYT